MPFPQYLDTDENVMLPDKKLARRYISRAHCLLCVIFCSDYNAKEILLLYVRVNTFLFQFFESKSESLT